MPSPIDLLRSPRSIIPLVFIRILVGLLAFLDLIGHYFVYYRQKEALVPGDFHFKYWGFDWIVVPPEPIWSIIFVVGAFAAWGVILGWRYRVSIFLLSIIYAFVFLSEEALYLNHGYLFTLLLFWLNLYPLNRFLSFDVKQGRVVQLDKVSAFYQIFLAFLMGCVYFFGGIAKLNSDWLRAQPMLIWLENKANYFLIGPLIAEDWFAWALSYGGLFFDLFISFGLLFKPTRKMAFLLVLLFHLINTCIFQIGIFPWLSIGLSAMFFGEAVFINLYHRLKLKLKWTLPELGSNEGLVSSKVLGLALVFSMVFCFMPFRHYLYSGDVAWTEEGHRYAWRMMLRSKAGYGYFRVVKPDGTSEKIRPSQELPRRISSKVYTHPDMILQYAHYLEERYKEEGPVEVYAHISCRLNDHPSQAYTDNTVDLTQVSYGLFDTAYWIVPPKWEKEQ